MDEVNVRVCVRDDEVVLLAESEAVVLTDTDGVAVLCVTVFVSVVDGVRLGERVRDLLAVLEPDPTVPDDEREPDFDCVFVLDVVLLEVAVTVALIDDDGVSVWSLPVVVADLESVSLVVRERERLHDRE